MKWTTRKTFVDIETGEIRAPTSEDTIVKKTKTIDRGQIHYLIEIKKQQLSLF